MKRIPFRAEEFISNEKTPVETFSNDSIVKVEITTVAGNTMSRYPVEGLATFRSGRVHDFTWTKTGLHDIEDPEHTNLNLWFSATPDGVRKESTLEDLVSAAYAKLDLGQLLVIDSRIIAARRYWKEQLVPMAPEGATVPPEIPPLLEKSIAVTFALASQYLANPGPIEKGGAK